MTDLTPEQNYSAKPLRIGENDPHPDKPTGEFISIVVSNEYVNDEYLKMVVEVPDRALKTKAGQFFHLLCPTPDGAEVWMRRPMSIYRVDQEHKRLEFLYKEEGRGTQGMAMLEEGEQDQFEALLEELDQAKLAESFKTFLGQLTLEGPGSEST